MAHGEESRRAVRRAFVFDQLTLEVAAVKCGVPIGTVRRWRAEAKAEGDDWGKARDAQFIAGGGMEDVMRQTLAKFVQQTQATMDGLDGDESIDAEKKVKLLASLADSFNKVGAVSKRVATETDKLGVAMDVLKRFGEYIAKRRPSLAAEFVEQIEIFGEELAKAYG